MKVLVIDDEKPTLSMFKLFLNAYGYEVYTAENGEKGIDLFFKIHPGIVFTDIKMPGMDGLEVLKRIRQSDIYAEVIIITGHGDMEKAVEALDLDALDFINKPVERQALNSALNRAEKRLKSLHSLKFKVRKEIKNNEFIVVISGKLSGENKKMLFDTISFDCSRENLNDAGQAAQTAHEAECPLTENQFAVVHEVFCVEDDRENAGKHIRRARIFFDENFSIDRTGISLLINFIKYLRAKYSLVHLENLSYNYIRFFQMAGIGKIAEITDCDTEY